MPVNERVVILNWKPIYTCPALPGVVYTVGNWNDENGCMDIARGKWVNACDFLAVPVAERLFNVEETGWWELDEVGPEAADTFGQPTYWLPE